MDVEIDEGCFCNMKCRLKKGLKRLKNLKYCIPLIVGIVALFI